LVVRQFSSAVLSVKPFACSRWRSSGRRRRPVPMVPSPWVLQWGSSSFYFHSSSSISHPGAQPSGSGLQRFSPCRRVPLVSEWRARSKTSRMLPALVSLNCVYKLTISCCCYSNAILQQAFPEFLDKCGFYTFFFFFGFNTFLAIFCWFWVPETKGISLEEIDTVCAPGSLFVLCC
jgi:hypothetical protein